MEGNAERFKRLLASSRDKLMNARQSERAIDTAEIRRAVERSAEELDGVTALEVQQAIKNIDEEQVKDLGDLHDAVLVSEDLEGWQDTGWAMDAPEGEMLRTYLMMLQHQGWSIKATEALGRSSRRILSKCADPAGEARIVRGMVIGQVQSGKTSSYLALANAALDAGYGSVIILAGTTNELRLQGQHRMDQGIAGSITAANGSTKYVGVGEIRALRSTAAHNPHWPLATGPKKLTSTAQGADGDFKPDSNLSHQINLAVIKKHGKFLRRIREWMTGQDDGIPQLGAGPVLIIDDEADAASVNTNDPDARPTTINREIRLLLRAIQEQQKVTYVAYTATPYATLMIDPRAYHPDHGLDLFPRDFIVVLDAPANYEGAVRFLASGEGDGTRIHIISGGDLRHRRKAAPKKVAKKPRKGSKAAAAAEAAADTQQEQPTPITLSALVPTALADAPVSLVEAIVEFLVTCGIRQARAARKMQARGHATMLVNGSQLQTAHRRYSKEIREILTCLLEESRHEPDAFRSHLRAAYARLGQEPALHVSFEEALPGAEDALWWITRGRTEKSASRHLDSAAGQADPHMRGVVIVNNDSSDRLDYTGEEQTIIAIGGNILSRGLTLEGLSTSVFMRESKAHDTLMQMGRWFGYRPGWADVARVHTSKTIVNAYRDILKSDLELWEDLIANSQEGRRPVEFGIKIRIAEGMMPTSANKRRAAMTTRRSASSTDTIDLTHISEWTASHNIEVADSFIGSLGPCTANFSGPDDKTGYRRVWDGVSTEQILDLLRDHLEPREELEEEEVDSIMRALSPKQKAIDSILGRIERSQADAEYGIDSWTVALVNARGSEHNSEGRLMIGDSSLKVVSRTSTGTDDRNLNRLSSVSDEGLGIPRGGRRGTPSNLADWEGSDDDEAGAPEPGTAKAASENLGRRALKKLREPRQGLLIGYAIQDTNKAGMKGIRTFAWSVSLPLMPEPDLSQGTVGEQGGYLHNRISSETILGKLGGGQE